MATTRNDFATQLLLFLLEKIPATLEPWGQAMLAELAVIDGFWTRLRWSLGGAYQRRASLCQPVREL